MQKYQTGAVRDTGGKGRMDLLPWSALIRVSKHMEDAILPDPETGTPHYPERNWEKGLPIHSMIDSAFRHLAKYVDGWVDEDHLGAAATNLLMAMWMEEHKPDMQDIPSRRPPVASSLPSDPSGVLEQPPAGEDQEKCQEEARSKRRCVFFAEAGGSKLIDGICTINGGMDPARCKGDRRNCEYGG